MADDAKPKPVWMRPKVILFVVAAVIIAIIILQNLNSVQTRILFLEMQMPQAFLLVIVAVIAYAAGVLTDGRMIRRKKD